MEDNTKLAGFEIKGFYEEILTRIGDAVKCLGTRRIPDPSPRPMGFEGQRDYTFTAPITLTCGHRERTFKASQQRPLICFGMAHAICGRKS